MHRILLPYCPFLPLGAISLPRVMCQQWLGATGIEPLLTSNITFKGFHALEVMLEIIHCLQIIGVLKYGTGPFY